MQQKMPKLDNLFFTVCRTAIKNTSWKYSEFERIKLVEGQLAALETYFEQLKETEPVEEGVGLDLPLTSTTPEKPAPAGQGEVISPLVDKDVIPALVALKTAPMASEQEKKN